MDKRGITWQMLVLGIIALVVLVLIILWFRSSGDKLFVGVGGQIDDLGDCDGDKVANMFDKCICLPEGTNPTFKGCSNEIKEETQIPPKDTSCCPKNE